MYARRKAVGTRGEVRSGYVIVAALAGRMGLEDAFTDGKDERDWIRESYDAFAASAAAVTRRLALTPDAAGDSACRSATSVACHSCCGR